jgi:hypothetical protein
MDDHRLGILDIQVWKLEAYHRFQRQRDCVVNFLSAALTPQILTDLPKRPEHLGSIESLSRAVVAEVRHSHLRLVAYLPDLPSAERKESSSGPVTVWVAARRASV